MNEIANKGCQVNDILEILLVLAIDYFGLRVYIILDRDHVYRIVFIIFQKFVQGPNSN